MAVTADCKMMQMSLSLYAIVHAHSLYASDHIGLHIVGRVCYAAIVLAALVEAVVRLILAAPAIPLAHCLNQDSDAKQVLGMSTLVGSMATAECALVAMIGAVTTDAITTPLGDGMTQCNETLIPSLLNLYGVTPPNPS